MNQVDTNAEAGVERKLTVLGGVPGSVGESAEREIVEQPVLSPKAMDELREILRSDETVREFFLLLKNRDLRKSAIEKLNEHLAR